MAESSHLTQPAADVYPNGYYCLTLAGYFPNGLTAQVVDAIQVPFDCYVKRCNLTYYGGTADIDALTIVTVDDPQAIITAADMSADIAGVDQDLDADVADEAYLINAGDHITLSADTQGANEAGWVTARIYVRKAYSGPDRR